MRSIKRLLLGAWALVGTKPTLGTIGRLATELVNMDCNGFPAYSIKKYLYLYAENKCSKVLHKIFKLFISEKYFKTFSNTQHKTYHCRMH